MLATQIEIFQMVGQDNVLSLQILNLMWVYYCLTNLPGSSKQTLPQNWQGFGPILGLNQHVASGKVEQATAGIANGKPRVIQ